jgi:SAM-dependent methyltransferase
MNNDHIVRVLKEIAGKFTPELIDAQLRDVDRVAFHIQLVRQAAESKDFSEIEMCDLGAGVGLFAVGCAALGCKRAVLIDDFNDPVNRRLGDRVLDLHRSYGVHVLSRDVVADGISDLPGQFDVITTFDSMEHWHRSPRELFQQVVHKLKPDGAFILAGPNCVNLRKRITVPLGRGKWSQMRDWYEPQEFRGHVREPDVDDFKYITRSMGLQDTRLYGRNWAGYQSSRAAIRLVTKLCDLPLRLRPSLCSDIYIMGKHPVAC